MGLAFLPQPEYWQPVSETKHHGSDKARLSSQPFGYFRPDQQVFDEVKQQYYGTKHQHGLAVWLRDYGEQAQDTSDPQCQHERPG